jgi:protein tyrosine/serine phosphatase
VSGAFNLRDLGLVSDVPYVRPGLLYRSGALAYITEQGKYQLVSELGVNLILDLRSQTEVKATPEPEVTGANTVWFPCEKDPKPLDISQFAAGREHGYSEQYLEILDIYAPSIGHAINYVKDEVGENKALLFHCTGEFFLND